MELRISSVLIGGWLACTACSAPQATAASSRPTVTPEAVRRAPLVFELHGHRFPSPLIRVEVAGRPTLMIVDSGATSNALTRWLADELHLTPTENPDEHGLDHSGRAVHVSVLEHLTIRAGEWPLLDNGSIVVVDVPEQLHALDIGGFLSPQSLGANGRTALLDLPRGELSLPDQATLSTRMASLTHDLAPSGIHQCGDVHDRRFVVPVTVNGTEAHLELDTGAGSTDVMLGSAAANALVGAASSGPGQTELAVTGSFTVHRVTGLHMHAGNFERVLDVDLVPPATRPDCQFDGVVGMDVLHQCAIAFTSEGASARCGD